MVDNYIRVLIKYQHGQEEEILCAVEKYPDINLFCKHYKKFIKALNYDYAGAGLLRASAYLETDDKFISNKGIISVSTDLLSVDRDPIEESANNLIDLNYFENIKRIADNIASIDSKLEDKVKIEEKKPAKKILLENKPKKQGVKKNAKTNSKK